MSHTNTKPEQNAAQHVQTGLPAAPDAQPQGFIDRYAKILVVVAVLCRGDLRQLRRADFGTGLGDRVLAAAFGVPVFCGADFCQGRKPQEIVCGF